MFVLIIILILIVAVFLILLGYRSFRWFLRGKKRFQVFLALVAVGVLAVGIHHSFFKKMHFIQSKVYSNLYLVKYPDKNYTAVQRAIREKIKEHLTTFQTVGETLAYTEDNGIYFYEYGGSVYGFIGEAGTGYFIDHKEDMGGFVSEELGMYAKQRLAECYYNTCASNAYLMCVTIDTFKEGVFYRTDSLNNISAATEYFH